MAAEVLALHEVDVFYGPVQALYKVSLHVRQGEVVVVLGGNASGKSTTVKTALGLVRPARGEVRLHGRRINGWSTHRIIRQGVASIPEGRRVFPEMTVRENILLGAYVRRREGRKRLEEDLEHAVALFPSLAGRLDQLAGTLSGGEQQMLAMARAWIRRPSLLCIDEPSMGLSPLYVDKVYEVIARLKAEGVTMLMVEQSANRALEVADRAYVLQNGRVVLEGSAQELIRNPAVQRAYLGGERREGLGSEELDRERAPRGEACEPELGEATA